MPGFCRGQWCLVHTRIPGGDNLFSRGVQINTALQRQLDHRVGKHRLAQGCSLKDRLRARHLGRLATLGNRAPCGHPIPDRGNGHHAHPLTLGTVNERTRVKIAEIRAELMRRRHQPVAVVGKWLNRVVQGYLNYHSVPGNLYRLGTMCKDINRAWRHSLMRRSQRPRMPWDRFTRIAKRFMPPIRNAHPYPEERFCASHT